MKNFVIAALAAALPLHAALAANTNAATKRGVAGQKIDSGLGDLPHYRHWADPSGKNLVTQQGTAQPSARSIAKAPRAAVAEPAPRADVATLK